MHKKSSILQLLTPSWVSALFIVIFSLTLTSSVLIVFTAHTSELQQYLVSVQPETPKRLTAPGEMLVEDDKPALLTSWPLLIVWALTGLTVYLLASYIVRAINDSVQFKRSLDYVNAAPKQAVRELAEHAALRSFAGIITFVLAVVVIKNVVPYCILAAHASASDLVSLNGLEYAVVSVGVMAFSLHILTVFLRLSFGRARLGS